MLVDLHTHELTYSPDSHQKLEDIVAEAKKAGLDGIAITDHDSMGLKEVAEAYSKEIGFPIFVGVEYFSLQGDIIAFGIDDFPKERINAQEFINYVHEQGGVTIACHPFRKNNRGLETLLGTIENLTCVEVLNGSTYPEENDLAMKYCMERGFKPTGGSDSHWVNRVGIYATELDGFARTTEELVYLIKNGTTKAVEVKGPIPFDWV